MKKRIKRIIITIVLCIVCGCITYFGTLMMDKGRNRGEVKVTVTFDDSKTYVIPSIKKMNEEEALGEWPYIINIKNDGDAKGLYQIIIKDIDSTIKKEDLDYLLKEDEQVVSKGHMKDLLDNILYTGSIDGNGKHEYKLYIWVTAEYEEGKYEYQLEFNTIKDGGPGF